MAVSSAGGSPPGSKPADKSAAATRATTGSARERIDRAQRDTQARLTFAAILHSRYGAGPEAVARVAADPRVHEVTANHTEARPMPQLRGPAPDGTVTLGRRRYGLGAQSSSQKTTPARAETRPPPVGSDTVQLTAATLEGDQHRSLLSPTVPSTPEQDVAAVALHARAAARAAMPTRRWRNASSETSERLIGYKEKGVEVER